MKLNLLAIFTVLSTCLLLNCLAPFSPEETHGPLSFTDSINSVSAKLGALMPDQKEYIFSPMSINVALIMLFEGTGSSLREKMSDTLHYYKNDQLRHLELKKFLQSYNISTDETKAKGLEIIKVKQEQSSHISGGWQRNPKPEPFELVLANSIWPSNSYTIKPNFTKTLKIWYNSSVTSLDYAGEQNSFQKINNWVSAKTNGKISKILQPLPSSTALVLVNAIYFKANWLYQFEKSKNYIHTFHNTALSTDENPTGPKVTYMVSKHYWFNYFLDSENNLFVNIPYARGPKGNISMIVMVPPGRGSEGDFSMANLDGVMSLLGLGDRQRSSGVKVELHFPKFKLETKLELTDICRAMGLGHMFSPDAGDFSGITYADDVAVGAIIHQAFIEVDEYGTEAAAATAVVMMKMAMPVEHEPAVYTIIKIDRPFGFWIMDTDKKAVLFSGKVHTPTAATDGKSD